MRIAISVSVCLSVSSFISETTCSNFTTISAHVTRGRGSVLFGRQSSKLCTFGLLGRSHVFTRFFAADGVESVTKWTVVPVQPQIWTVAPFYAKPRRQSYARLVYRIYSGPLPKFNQLFSRPLPACRFLKLHHHPSVTFWTKKHRQSYRHADPRRQQQHALLATVRPWWWWFS